MSTITRLLAFILMTALLCHYADAAQPAVGSGAEQAKGYRHDFDVFWNQINKDYPYFSTKATNWRCVKSFYRPQVLAAKNEREFIRILELAIGELGDPHASLNVNLSTSTRLIPSGLDLWAEWRDERAYVTQLRPGFAAQQAGLRVGMEIVAVNGVAIRQAMEAKIGHCISHPNAEVVNWALLSVVAGQHDTARIFTLRSDGGDTIINLDTATQHPQESPVVTSRLLENNLGYIALHQLGSVDSIALFDSAIQEFKTTRGLILDLRDTPGGGNTRVAEPILGRLIDRAQDYQRVVPRHGKSWSARVQPRGPWTYKAPIVVLVSRWTGSMGEGMAIGLDGMHRATSVGTPMAGLNGGVFTHHLSYTDMNFTFPAEKLLHLDGLPRELFNPTVLVDLSVGNPDGQQDLILDEGIRQLKALL